MIFDTKDLRCRGLRSRILGYAIRVRAVPRDKAIAWPARAWLRTLAWFLLTALVIFAHGCHGEDHDDELCFRAQLPMAQLPSLKR